MAADEEADVFEITDFTTASEWERFISRLEEILHGWKLVNHPNRGPALKDVYTSGDWEEKSEDIFFADFKFTVTFIYLKVPESGGTDKKESQSPEQETEQDNADDESDGTLPTVFVDMMNMDNDFPFRAHCLCRWYGLQEFIVAAPASNSDVIENESRMKLLMSSISIALHNTECKVPLFVQFQQWWRKIYSGMCVMPDSTVEYEMVHLKKLPSQYNHLEGLLDIFKGKLGSTVSPRPPVSVSVRFTYVLQEWVNSPWPQSPPDFSSSLEGDVGCSDFRILPFGACEDPVSELHLSCTWPSLSEDMIVENQVYSDLDPLQAPQWTVRIQMTEDPQCLLGEYLKNCLQLCHRKETTDELLGCLFTEDSDNDQGADISQALQRLTQPSVSYNMPSLTTVMSQASSRLRIKAEEAPVPTELLNEILLYLFPDAKDSENTEKEGSKDEDSDELTEDEMRHQTYFKQLSKDLKSSPVNSVVHKLAVSLFTVNYHHGGLRAVAHLWQEFVLEMRYRLENNYFISGVENGQPNMGSCLLHQKLQMLNCCIERKIKREQLHKGYTGRRHSTDVTDLIPTDDNYIGCPEDVSMETDDAMNISVSETADNNESCENEHRASEQANMRLASNVDSSSEDEFFECAEENQSGRTEPVAGAEMVARSEMAGENTIVQSMSTSSLASNTSFKISGIPQHRPEGRLTPCGDLKLLRSGEQMYIPVTQEPSPMTEDMLDEQAEVLAKLGSSPEGTQLRAKMQSACLLSDMESFKAANPGCALEDFVRWYSPRDWIPNEGEEPDNEMPLPGEKGQLSQRMLIPGNMWVEVWQSAQAIPAHRQKRLFDDTKEAEKILHFLSAMKPGAVVLHLLPCLVHAAIIRVIENDDSDIPKLRMLLDQVIGKAAKVLRSPHQEIRRYEDLIKMISLAEVVIARAKSLKTKFTEELLDQPGAEEELNYFVSNLLQHPEVSIRGGPCGPAGSVIHKLFIAAQKSSYLVLDDETEENSGEAYRQSPTIPDFPNPSGREYILRTWVPRPAPYSKTLPHRMYCVLVDNDYRLAGAFSHDTIFQ
ncbi:hypothetical protein ScPMuIL_017074 [Solemya velum]